MEYVICWLLFGIISGIIGSRKGIGCSSVVWGGLLGPFGILLALVRAGTQVTCPYCCELVKKEARVCKHCGKDLINNVVSPSVRMASGKKFLIRKKSKD